MCGATMHLQAFSSPRQPHPGHRHLVVQNRGEICSAPQICVFSFVPSAASYAQQLSKRQVRESCAAASLPTLSTRDERPPHRSLRPHFWLCCALACSKELLTSSTRHSTEKVARDAVISGDACQGTTRETSNWPPLCAHVQAPQRPGGRCERRRGRHDSLAIRVGVPRVCAAPCRKSGSRSFAVWKSQVSLAFDPPRKREQSRHHLIAVAPSPHTHALHLRALLGEFWRDLPCSLLPHRREDWCAVLPELQPRRELFLRRKRGLDE